MTVVAVAQIEPIIGETERNVDKSLEFCVRAADQEAKLIVLPELCNTGYTFSSRDEANALAEPVPEGPTAMAWLEFCRDSGAYIVAGITEEDNGKLFNSSVVLGPRGHVGTFRKLHLWNRENLFFEPGDRGCPVFHLPFGRIATFICYDGWFPELYRLATIQGADLLCVPTNWVPIPGQAEGQQAMANILCMANAHSNSVFIAAADRVGVERGQPFVGQSLIVAPTGWPVAGPASEDKEELLIADIDLTDARTARDWNDFNQPIRDRRTDFYGETLGADVTVGWY